MPLKKDDFYSFRFFFLFVSRFSFNKQNKIANRLIIIFSKICNNKKTESEDHQSWIVYICSLIINNKISVECVLWLSFLQTRVKLMLWSKISSKICNNCKFMFLFVFIQHQWNLNWKKKITSYRYTEIHLRTFFIDKIAIPRNCFFF